MLRSVPTLTGRLRAVVAAGPFLAVTVAFAGIYAAVSGRLPDPLATHFRFGGQADGFTSVQGFLTESLALFLLLGAVVGFFIQVRPDAPEVPWVIAGGYALAGSTGYVFCVTLLSNADAADVSAVRVPQWEVFLSLAVALCAGALGRLLAGAAPAAPRRPRGAVSRLDLPAAATAGWSRTIGSPPLAVLGGLLLVGGLLIGLFADWIASAGLLFGAAVSLPMASVRVTVDRRGLTLAPALLSSRCRFRRVPLDRIEEAGSRRIACFAEFGGWGYRIRAGRSGFVLRSGEGIVVRLTNGREFVVTVDDAATAAALLNTYTDRARSRQGG
ncbi:DUF1648 domain-containing protein [Streptomyces platensis]|uniref:DUF1648 domain-containing protein n=1 Tax=Streptomyces platensis TaxID=58346 RepID=UPI001F32E9F9|nr:DUF1648 domain-containing protein [Streptomyces platensis]MCF3145208.1 DUF1648 domain-containing protein [Streptomyces platensis]